MQNQKEKLVHKSIQNIKKKKEINFQRTQWWWMKFLKITKNNWNNPVQPSKFVTQIMRPDHNVKGKQKKITT
jgi:hypothetical protein